MYVDSHAIVLNSIKYGDNSIILKTYTRKLGLCSFIVGRVHSKHGAVKPSMVQPLSILNLVFSERSRGTLKRIKEASIAEGLTEIFYNPIKSSLTLFLAEILQHVLHEEESNPALFDFVKSHIIELDLAERELGSFHLRFLYKLSAYLGFQPECVTSDSHFFDLIEGCYSVQEPAHHSYLANQSLANWKRLEQCCRTIDQDLGIKTAERKELLNALLIYYRFHIKDFGNLKTVDVLSEILN